MLDPCLPRTGDDSRSLRPMLMKWAAQYYPSEGAQQTLVERTIVFAPDRLYCEKEEESVETTLAALMREIASEDGTRTHASTSRSNSFRA